MSIPSSKFLMPSGRTIEFKTLGVIDLTKREWFAAMSLGGNHKWQAEEKAVWERSSQAERFAAIAEFHYGIADAMIAASKGSE